MLKRACAPASWRECSGAHVLLPAATALFSRLRNVAPGPPRERHRGVALCPGCFGPIRTKAAGCVGPGHLWSPFPSAPPDCEDRGRLGPLGPLPPVRSVWDAGLRSRRLDSGVVPVPCLSLGPQPHNERGARGALAHLENVPPGALAEVLHRRPRTPLCLWCGQ